ncbi:MAG TPA: hypothetical protein ENJ45_01150 [Phaeodactylibacter sp.]|nr:hypothetical protein [Phaeodactylibacter sp.]
MNTKQLFTAFTKVKVMVVGDVMIDSYLWGKVERISPEAPVPVLAWQGEEKRLGGAANVALNLQALGAKVMLCSVVGADSRGKDFKQLLKKEKLSTKGICILPQRQTSLKRRIIAGSQHLLRIDREDTDDLGSEERQLFTVKVLDKVTKSFCPDVLVFQDYDKGLLCREIISHLFRWAKAQQIPTVVDPKHRHFFDYKNCSLFKPNLKEVCTALGKDFSTDRKGLAAADRELRKRMPQLFSMITLSEKGVFISDGKVRKIVPTQPRVVSDVCGAGDTVLSIAALGMALGLALEQIAALANIAGGQVCEQPGVVPVDRKKLMEEVREMNLPPLE